MAVYNCKSKLKLVVQHILDMSTNKYSKDFNVHELKTEDVSFTSDFECSTEFEDKKVPITFKGNSYDEYMYQSELLTSSLVFFHKGKSRDISTFLAAMGVSITRILFATLMCLYDGDDEIQLSFDALYTDIIKLMSKYISSIGPTGCMTNINRSTVEDPVAYINDFLMNVVKDQEPN